MVITGGRTTATVSQLHSRQIPRVLLVQRPPAVQPPNCDEFYKRRTLIRRTPRSLFRNSYSNNEHVTYSSKHHSHARYFRLGLYAYISSWPVFEGWDTAGQKSPSMVEEQICW